MPAPATHEAYFATKPPAVRALLEQLRATILKAVPDAEPCISYAMPAFRMSGRVALFIAGWKAHVSVYPASAAIREAVGDAGAAFIHSRGTFQFPLTERLPLALVGRIARARAAELAAMPPLKRQVKQRPARAPRARKKA